MRTFKNPLGKNNLTSFCITVLFSLSLTFNSCTKSELPKELESEYFKEYKIPSTDTLSLRKFDSDNDIVNYKLARKIALIDMTVNGYFKLNHWEGCTLSEIPVVIWGLDERPQLYDFILVDENMEPQGTISVSARKEHAMQIREMNGNVVNYEVFSTKSGGDNRIFVDVFGSRYVAPVTKSGSYTGGVAYSARTGESVTGLSYMTIEQGLEYMRDKILPFVFEGNVQNINQTAKIMESDIVAEAQAAKKFWNAISANEAGINAWEEGDDIPAVARMIEDDTYDKPWDDNGGSGGGGTPTPTIKMTPVFGDEVCWLKEYQEWFVKYNSENNYKCGSWIAGFILSTNYNKWINPKDFDYYSVQGGLFEGAITAPQLNNILKDYSQGKIEIFLTSVSRWTAYWRIREQQSVVRLGMMGGLGLHWTHMYGSFRVDRLLTTNYYFLQADNGFTVASEMKNRKERDQRNNDHYTILGALDAIFPVVEHKKNW